MQKPSSTAIGKYQFKFKSDSGPIARCIPSWRQFHFCPSFVLSRVYILQKRSRSTGEKQNKVQYVFYYYYSEFKVRILSFSQNNNKIKHVVPYLILFFPLALLLFLRSERVQGHGVHFTSKLSCWLRPSVLQCFFRDHICVLTNPCIPCDGEGNWGGGGGGVGWFSKLDLKLLCSPVRAASLSTECCIFLFWSLQTNSCKKGGTSEMTDSWAGLALSSLRLLLSKPHRGKKYGHVCVEDFQGPRAWSCDSAPPAHPHPHSSHSHRRVLVFHECLTDSKKQVVTQN